MTIKQAIEGSNLNLPRFKEILYSKFKPCLSKPSKMPVIAYFRIFLDTNKSLLSDFEIVSLEDEYKQAIKKIEQDDAMTSLLGLFQALLDQFDVLEGNPIYLNIFRKKIKNNANQLREDILNALNVYYKSCRTPEQMWEIGDMVISLSSISIEYMKIAYRMSELDKKEKDDFYHYHNSLMKKFHFPIKHQESLSNEPLTIEDIDRLVKLNDIEYKERKKELLELKQQLQDNDN